MASELCEICKCEIKTMAFKGTGVCGEIHRKQRAGEIDHEQALTDAGLTNLLAQPTGKVDLGKIV